MRNKDTIAGLEGTGASQALLEAGRASLLQRLAVAKGAGEDSGFRFEREHSALIDRFFQTRLAEIYPEAAGEDACPPFALVAVGGYGRSELCPHSDIDILVVSRDTISPDALDLAQPLFLPLWDLKYDLGHGFKTIKDCLRAASTDFSLLASFLDMRFIAGGREVFDDLASRLRAKVFSKKKKAFFSWLEANRRRRLKRYGDASVMIEPHLKEGIGGLRDYHRILWLAKLCGPGFQDGGGDRDALRACLSPEELGVLESAVSFLLLARNHLHLTGARRNDVLHLELQPEIALEAGCADSESATAVELFLSRLHRSMEDIKALDMVFWLDRTRPRPSAEHEPTGIDGIVATGRYLDFAPGFDPGGDLAELMKIFEALALASDPEAGLSWDARRAISAGLEQGRGQTRGLEETRAAYPAFERILLSGKAGSVLGAMLETGLLGVFLPEFESVRDRVQFDAYHTFPVGRHTLMTIRHLEELSQGRKGGRDEVFSDLWAKVQDKRIPLLAALFHDTGKGSPEHEKQGAEIAESTCKRWGLPQDVTQEVVFLVRNHLLLPITATRRDLGEESVILECAGRANTRERLTGLYLLAYADSKATGPRAWNGWIAGLMAELYSKGIKLLGSGDFHAAGKARKILRTRDQVRALVGSGDQDGPLDSAFVEQCLDNAPSRYTLALSSEDIFRHLKLVRRMRLAVAEEERRLPPERAIKGLVEIDPRPGQADGVWEVVFTAMDQKGLFASIVGILTLHGFNIYSADCFIWRDGVVLDIFRVSEPRDPLYADVMWTRMRGALKYAMRGKFSLETRLEEKRRSMLSQPGPGGRRVPPKVSVDNKATDFYTVLEIESMDRSGLLYDIAKTLLDQGVHVQVARAVTKGDLVSDIFYIRDRSGQKVEEPARIRELSQALVQALSDS